MFSSKSFVISGFAFRFLIHFQFIFVYGIRKCSHFILLLLSILLSQNYLLKMLSLCYCIFLPPLSKIRYAEVCGFTSWLSILFPWPIFLFFMPVSYSLGNCSFVVLYKVKKIDSSRFVLLSHYYFGYLETFVFPYEL